MGTSLKQATAANKRAPTLVDNCHKCNQDNEACQQYSSPARRLTVVVLAALVMVLNASTGLKQIACHEQQQLADEMGTALGEPRQSVPAGGRDDISQSLGLKGGQLQTDSERGAYSAAGTEYGGEFLDQIVPMQESLLYETGDSVQTQVGAGRAGEWPAASSPDELTLDTPITVYDFSGQERPLQSSRSDEEVFLMEDKDYPKSLFEDYSKKVGQISGITTLPTGDVVIFHRAGRQWTRESEFPQRIGNSSSGSLSSGTSNKTETMLGGEALEDQLIKNDTLMIIDGETGEEVWAFGDNLFYMPHSVTSDSKGNLWVSDVARHQVMRLPTSQLADRQAAQSSRSKMALEAHPKHRFGRRVWPDIVLGEAFSPGNDEAHFCQPAELAVSRDGRLVFVADGYCNKRIVVLTGEGKYLGSFGEAQQMLVVHSLTLIEDRNLLCVGDRENARILCYLAGLDGDLDSIGQLILELDYPIGRVFALTSIGSDHLLVSSNQNGTSRYDLALLNPFSRELKLVWTSSDLLEPHSLTRTLDQQYAYAADVSADAFKKVFKFNIITTKGGPR